MRDPLVEGCLQAIESGRPINIDASDGSLPTSLVSLVREHAYSGEIHKGIITPISSLVGGELLGFLIVGLNPRCPFDDEHQLWTSLVADLLIKSASLISLPKEHRGAQKIADDLNRSLARQLRLTTLQAEKSEAKFSRMAEFAPTGMFLFDPDGRPLYVNQAYLDLLGDTKEHTDARDPSKAAWQDQIHPDDIDSFIGIWHQLLETKTPVMLEYRLKKRWKSVDKATGEELTGERWLSANAFPELEADGTISSVQGWLTDISHRKFAESLLNTRLNDALETKKQTERFIDTTCHEIRNPLSAILQSADSISSTLRQQDTPMLYEDMVSSLKFHTDSYKCRM